MIRRTLITLIGLASALAAQDSSDLLRFSNGDQLHGRFLGIGPGSSLLWQRDDIKEPLQLDIQNLRHAVLHNGSPAQPLQSLSLVELINGDQIPGTIKAMDEGSITLETSYAGTIILPRSKVVRLAPHPMGGKIHYHGPFSPAGWKILDLPFAGNFPQAGLNIRINGAEAIPLHQADENGKAAAEDDKQQKAEVWQHAGASWYWKGDRIGSSLIRPNGLPKSSVLRFDLAWKGHLNVAIGIHADFCTLEKNQQDGDEKEAAQPLTPNNSANYPQIFGNGYVLQMHSNYLVIYRTVVNEDGETSALRVQTPSSRIRLGENSQARIELRSDLGTGNFSLFVDDEFITQWNDKGLGGKELAALTGSGFGFLPQFSNGVMKLTDVIISEWNGMPDSARSMQVEEQDIIVMTNGLDRLSGKALTLDEGGLFEFKSAHGSFQLPIGDIAEIRFARKPLEQAEAATDKMLKVRFSPLGTITGIPLSGEHSAMVLRSQLAGDITLNTEAAVMLEFDATQQFFDDWNENF